MPIRHCVFVCDLAEMEENFKLPLSVYVDEFLERASPGDRLREYAELAFATEQKIQTLRKADRNTLVMARRLVAGLGDANPRGDLALHLGSVTGEYVHTRTTSQLKWLLHAFAASGRMWIRELVCSAGREWVEEILNLLFIQRGFVPADDSPEERLERFQVTRAGALKLSGPFPVKEGENEASDSESVSAEEFPWVPREDGITSFRMIPGNDVYLVTRTLSALDLSPEAFRATGRTTPERLQEITRENANRLRQLLALPYAGPVVLAFIGA